jgi:sulfite exporter TauE/SafE
MMKAFSYAMIGAFVAGLGLTFWGSAGVLAGL